jgi:hypothetical protein
MTISNVFFQSHRNGIEDAYCFDEVEEVREAIQMDR